MLTTFYLTRAFWVFVHHIQTKPGGMITIKNKPNVVLLVIPLYPLVPLEYTIYTYTFCILSPWLNPDF